MIATRPCAATAKAERANSITSGPRHVSAPEACRLAMTAEEFPCAVLFLFMTWLLGQVRRQLYEKGAGLFATGDLHKAKRRQNDPGNRETVRQMRFVFPHSHAFRRGRVTVDDDGRAGPECLVEFGDGVTVIAEWQADQDAIRLSVPDYRTAKGTLVTGRTWRLARGKDGLWRSERLS